MAERLETRERDGHAGADVEVGSDATDRLVWRSRALEELVRIGITLTSENDLSVLLGRALEEARRFTRAEAGTLFLRDGDRLRFAVVQNDLLARRLGEREVERQFQAEPLECDAPALAAYVARTGRIVNVPDAYRIPAGRPYTFCSDWDARNAYRTRSVLAAPLRESAGTIVGVLQLINARDERGEIVPFDQDLEPLVLALATQAAVAIRNTHLAKASFKDALTGSYSRRYFTLRLEEEVKRYDRFGHPLSLVLVDIDHFKQLSDAHGQTAGDETLAEIARLLQQHSRSFTVVARLGGDQFAALLVNTPKAGAVAYAERIRRLLEEHAFTHGFVTASFGIACFPDDLTSSQDGASARDLMQAADAALYEAKRAGGNTVGRL
ncbi:MAG: sensor domain-containing diguanylate cyclase [Candidatus Rokubacteria bacterium]|nr:sensor domain-containing diguanylate cyclase [Candidatus Rokubacteria bacterium]